MSVVRFTKNFRDRSTDSGFQFEFFCDRGYGQWFPNWLSYHFPETCNYSYTSTVQSYPVGVANKVKEAASWLANRWPQISPANDAINTIHKEAWESAFASAVQEAKRHFRNCPNCNKWVCSHACWNETAGTCKNCSVFPGGKNSGSEAQPTTIKCPHCKQQTESGKFCDMCGKSLAIKVFCGNCGKQVEGERRFKFCPHCGDSLAYLDETQD